MFQIFPLHLVCTQVIKDLQMFQYYAKKVLKVGSKLEVLQKIEEIYIKKPKYISKFFEVTFCSTKTFILIGEFLISSFHVRSFLNDWNLGYTILILMAYLMRSDFNKILGIYARERLWLRDIFLQKKEDRQVAVYHRVCSDHYNHRLWSYFVYHYMV